MLEPFLMSQEPAPQRLLELTTCKCTKSVSRRDDLYRGIPLYERRKLSKSSQASWYNTWKQWRRANRCRSLASSNNTHSIRYLNYGVHYPPKFNFWILILILAFDIAVLKFIIKLCNGKFNSSICSFFWSIWKRIFQINGNTNLVSKYIFRFHVQ